jgi:hypothetical protein
MSLVPAGQRGTGHASAGQGAEAGGECFDETPSRRSVSQITCELIESWTVHGIAPRP